MSPVGLGQLYRIDQHRCPDWPPLHANLAAASGLCRGVCVAQHGLVALAAAKPVPRRDQVPIRPCLRGFPHLPPGWGRQLCRTIHCSMPRSARPCQRAQSISAALPVSAPDDALLRLLVPHWRCGNSAYLAGFHAVASLVAAGAKTTCWHLRPLIVSAIDDRSRWADGAGPKADLHCGRLWRRAGRLKSSLHRPSGRYAHNDALLALATGGWCLRIAVATWEERCSAEGWR